MDAALDKIFEAYDSNQNGFVEKEVTKEFFTDVFEVVGHSIPEKVKAKVIEKIERKDHKQISREEFSSILSKCMYDELN